jgi:nonribosomal peptide synthetase DhbF
MPPARQADLGPLPYSPLLPLRATGERSALFCVHPAGGSATVFSHLAEALGPSQPVWGLQARGLEAGETPHASLAEMLADYVSAIRTVQPHGPYHLLGWSFGGVIAHAMACHLETEGETIATLALLDAGIPTRTAEQTAQPLRPGDLANFLGLPADSFPEDDAAQEQILLEAAVRHKMLLPGTDPFWIRRLLRQFRLSLQLLCNHTPGICRAPILLFVAAARAEADTRRTALAWEPYTSGGVRRILCQTRHADMLDRGALDLALILHDIMLPGS